MMTLSKTCGLSRIYLPAALIKLIRLGTICLFILQVSAAWSLPKTLPKKYQLGPYQAAAIQDMTPSELEKLMDMVETIQSIKPLYQYLNEVFAFVRKGPAEAKTLQTDQIAYLLYYLPEAIPVLKQYSKIVTPTNYDDPKVVAFRKKMKAKFERWLKQEDLKNNILTMDSPTEPLFVKAATNNKGFTAIETFVNHPQLKDPKNPNSPTLPADDLQEEYIRFIDGATKSLMINIYEFNLPRVAEAAVRAKARGVNVIIGIDKNTINNDKSNQNVREILRKEENKDFVVVEVDPVGINHQKIIVRDAGTDIGAVFYSTGNFTQSCSGKEGDLPNIPASKRPALSRPNANHAIVVHSPLMAVITKYELRKTLVLKLRGAEYPISGSFVFDGPGTDFAMLAFSPNGGMGDVNRDILAKVISAAKGPIWDMAFAFSAPEISAAIKKRAKDSPADFDLKTMGDTAFAMRPWSGFLDLSGLTYNESTNKYESKIDPEGLKASLGEQKFSKIQSQIRVNPYMFGDFTREIDGVSYKISVKLHHKSMGFPQMGWAFMGKSFNDSASAESNQEQIVLVGNRAATQKLEGAFAWLYKQAPLSVASYATYRNKHGIKPLDVVSGKQGQEVEAGLARHSPGLCKTSLGR